MSEHAHPGTILLAGASRGLGLGLTCDYLERGWAVIATARDPAAATDLTALHAKNPERLRIETLDVADPASITALAKTLQGTTLDVIFIVAGMNKYATTPIHEVPPEDAASEFLTNAYAPPALAEALSPLAAPGATYVFMTSILGSIASNAGGGMELYRATKSALNMLGSCFALRHKASPVILLHPGWVRTDMGGEKAPLDVETSVRGQIDAIASRAGKPGIGYLDYQGQTLPW
jgi:NAD(P)-dependent dehydrogenase (short-subunit alcohol dehydrogenase family)